MTARPSGLEAEGKYSNIDLNSINGNISIITEYKENSSDNEGVMYGLYANEGTIDLTSGKDVLISSGNEKTLLGNNYGVYVSSGLVNIESDNVYINSYSYGPNSSLSHNGGVRVEKGGKTYINASGDFIVDSKSKENNNLSTNYGIYNHEVGTIFEAEVAGDVLVYSDGYNSTAIDVNTNGSSYDAGHFKITSGGHLYVSAKGYGGTVYSVKAHNSINILKSDNNLSVYGSNNGGLTYGVNAIGNTNKSITYLSGQNVFISSENTNGSAYGLYAKYTYDAAYDPYGEHVDDINLAKINSGNNLYLTATANNGTAYGACIDNSVVKAEAQGSSFIVQ